MKRKTKIILVGLLPIALAIGLAIPILGRATNCGGNSAAMCVVHGYASYARTWAETVPTHIFQIKEAMLEKDSTGKPEVAAYAHSSWLSAHFLVSTAPVLIPDKNNKSIIIVCDTPYSNVPRPWIGRAAPAYAVGYSDGTVGLIPLDEFAGLDRSAFVDLTQLLLSDVVK